MTQFDRKKIPSSDALTINNYCPASDVIAGCFVSPFCFYNFRECIYLCTYKYTVIWVTMLCTLVNSTSACKYTVIRVTMLCTLVNSTSACKYTVIYVTLLCTLVNSTSACKYTVIWVTSLCTLMNSTSACKYTVIWVTLLCTLMNRTSACKYTVIWVTMMCILVKSSSAQVVEVYKKVCVFPLTTSGDEFVTNFLSFYNAIATGD